MTTDAEFGETDVLEAGPRHLAVSARSTALAAAYNYGAQVATVLVQFGYAALTSRLLAPAAFGEYGAALTIAGLVTVVAVAGLPQAVSRMTALEPARLTALLAYALGVGAVAAAALAIPAEGWASLWHIPGTAHVLRVLAVSMAVLPALSFAQGLMLRLGRYRLLATATFVANLAGMAVGLAAVLVFRQPWALVVSTVVAQVGATVVLLIAGRRNLKAAPRISRLLEDVTYSGRVTVGWVLWNIWGNIGKVFVSNSLGSVALGLWNRADVLTIVPFYQVQNALMQALYPQLGRNAEDRTRARRVWSDLLGLVAWVCLPPAAVLAVLCPVVVPVLFGDRWHAVADYTPFLALIGGLQAVFFVLVSALEITGRTRWVWAGHAAGIAVATGGGVVALALGTVLPALAGLLGALLVMHALHLTLSGRAGMLDVRALLRHYAAAAAGATVTAAVTLAGIAAAEELVGRAWAAAGAAVGLGLVVAVAWMVRDRLPLVAIARRFGVLSRRS